MSFLADISAGHQLNKDGLVLYAVHSQLGEKSADLVKSNAYNLHQLQIRYNRMGTTQQVEASIMMIVHHRFQVEVSKF